MAVWSLYEEQKQDGSIPEHVLAFHKDEFKRYRRDPRHRPRHRVVPNPCKIRKKNRDIEVEAALVAWGQQNIKPANEQQGQGTIRTPSKPLEKSRLAQVEHMARFPGSYSISGSQQRSLFRALLPPTDNRRPWQGVQVEPMEHKTQSPPKPANYEPKPYPISSAGPQTQSTNTTQHTASRSPSSQHIRPILGSIWNIVNEVKACKVNKYTKLPYRADLKTARFREHFASNGVLRPDSDLATYEGDTRLFRLEVWKYLLSPLHRGPKTHVRAPEK